MQTNHIHRSYLILDVLADADVILKKMKSIKQLQEKYNLEIKSPFLFSIDNKDYEFQCLIKGYGAKNGMVIDKEWSRIKEVHRELSNMGYGYSCFNIEESEVEGFEELLEDWGKIKE